MKTTTRIVLTIVMILSVASMGLALARGAPPDAGDTVAAVSVDAVTPSVELRTVPPMTVGDAIQDQTRNVPAYSRLATADQSADTSDLKEQGTTGDERTGHPPNSQPVAFDRSQPEVVLLS